MNRFARSSYSSVLAVLVAGTLASACSGSTEGDDRDAGGSDAGTTGGSDAGSGSDAGTAGSDAGTSEPDAGMDTTPPPRRMLDVTGAVTNTTTFGTPECGGPCAAGTTYAYPDGADFTQWAQVADPADGSLVVSVTRSRTVTASGAVRTEREYLAFSFPRDARGTVSCAGPGAAGRVALGRVKGFVESHVANATCSFDVESNSATQLKITVKTPISVPAPQGSFTIGAGAITFPLRAFAAIANREQDGNFTVTARMGDGTNLSASRNPRVFHNDGEVAATAVGTAPGNTDGTIDVRVPVEALGPVACHKDAPASVGVSFMMQNQLYAFSSGANTVPGCYLLVVRNDRSALTITNAGRVDMPAALGSAGGIAIDDLDVDATVRVP